MLLFHIHEGNKMKTAASIRRWSQKGPPIRSPWVVGSVNTLTTRREGVRLQTARPPRPRSPSPATVAGLLVASTHSQRPPSAVQLPLHEPHCPLQSRTAPCSPARWKLICHGHDPAGGGGGGGGDGGLGPCERATRLSSPSAVRKTETG